VTYLPNPAIQRVVDAATRRGVDLDIRLIGCPIGNVEEAASLLDAAAGQIVTSVVFVAPRPESKLVPLVCLMSGRNSADPILLGAVTGEVAIRLASPREVRDLTGCPISCTPPFGHGSDVRIVMDQDLCGYQWVWATAGTETAVFRVSPRTLRMLSNALVTPLASAPAVPPRIASGRELGLRFETGPGA
jgi:prolyl-tRNA editing enzyme YbaK/EbsC (Cys-tRNA(Pro) deacylase)